MIKQSGLAFVGLATIVMIVAPAMGQTNLLLNPGFETVAGSEPFYPPWTREQGTLDGMGLGESPRSGVRSWHGAWNWSGSAQTTTYYQDVSVGAGSICTAQMWCKANAWGGVYGNDTHYFRLTLAFLDATNVVLASYEQNSPQPNDTYQLVEIANKTAPANTAKARVKFSYITTQFAHAWKVWNVDDMSLTATSAGQPVLLSMTPKLIADNASNTNATITGMSLLGATAAKLVMGATVLTGTINTNTDTEMTVTFPTAGAPAGRYDVIVEKTGYDSGILSKYFTIRGPGLNLLLNGDFELGVLGQVPMYWSRWEADWGGITDISAYNSVSIFNPTPLVWNGNYGMRHQESGTGEAGTLQVIDVIPGEQLELSWVWSAGDQATGTWDPDPRDRAWRAVGVQSGVITSAQSVHGDLGEVEIPSLNGSFNWTAPTPIQFTVPQGVTQITVYTKTGHCCVNNLVATYFDDMTLMAPGACPTQHETTSASPPSNDNNHDTTITIQGSNLDLVTAVKLISLTGGPTLVGTNPQLGPNNESLTVTFATTGAKEGAYDIKTEQDWPCQFRVLSSAFTLTCPDPSAITTVSPGVISKPPQPGVTQFTIDGSNLGAAFVGDVKLVRQGGGATIFGQKPYTVQTDGQIVANFDLSSAPEGTYDMVAVRSDGCNDAVAQGAFVLQCGAGGPSFLATVDTWGGMSGTTNFTFDLTGTGLQSLTEVRLVKLYENNSGLPGSASNPIVSTSLTPNLDGTRLTVTMNLTGAEGGRYKVEATHPCDEVTYAPGFADGPFLMWMPFNSTPGPNGRPRVFQNPSFEEAYDNSTNPGFCEPGYNGHSNPKPKHWDQVNGQRVEWGTWSRDKSLGFGSPPFDCTDNGPTAIIDGEHYEDQTHDQTTAEKKIAFFQTVDISPLLDQNGALIEDLTIRAIFFLHVSPSGYIEVRDGPENATGQVWTSAAIPAVTGDLRFVQSPDWYVTVPAGTIINPSKIITLIFRAEKPVTAAAEFVIMRVDNVYTGPFVQSGCPSPFADNDRDGDVDQEDFAALQLCTAIPMPDGCGCFDRDGSGTINQVDISAFEACASGPGIAADPGCGQP